MNPRSIDPTDPVRLAPTHFAADTEIASVLRTHRTYPVVTFIDNLLVGPSAWDPNTHLSLRGEYWGNRRRQRRNLMSLWSTLHLKNPLVVWTSNSLEHRVALWMLCAWLERAGRKSTDVRLVTLPERKTPHLFVCSGAILHGGEIGPRIEAAVALPEATRRRAEGLWKKFVDKSPKAFSDQCQRGLRGFPEVRSIGTYHAGFFPQYSGTRLAISRFDQVMFACVSGEWATPVTIFSHRSAEGDFLRNWLSCAGDIFLSRRLRDWADHDCDEVALESRPLDLSNPMRSHLYRLTSRGKDIARNGLGNISQGPRLAIGGAMAYDPSAPWVIRTTPHKWSMELG